MATATGENKALMEKLAREAPGTIAKKKEPQTLKDWTQLMAPQIAKALPKVITPERFTRIALTAISNTPKLANCERDSFLGALMQAAQLGLEPNTPLGEAYLIPYGNKVQFQIGYKGLLNLAYRSQEIKTIGAYAVYENDTFDYELGLDPKLSHKPALTDRGEMIAVYAYYKTVNGGYGFEVMSKSDVEKHAKKYSQSYNSSSSPWKTNFDSMAKKTVLKQVLKYAPVKSEFLQAATVTDEATLKATVENPGHIDVEYTVSEGTDESGISHMAADPETGEVLINE